MKNRYEIINGEDCKGFGLNDTKFICLNGEPVAKVYNHKKAQELVRLANKQLVTEAVTEAEHQSDCCKQIYECVD